MDTITVVRKCVQAHVLTEKAEKTTDPAERLILQDKAKQLREGIGPVAFKDALALIARNGPVAQQAHGWARLAIAQLGMKGKFNFGDTVIEVV